jgi:hypothetical protein
VSINGRSYNTHEVMRYEYKIYIGKREGKTSLGDPDVDRKIILKTVTGCWFCSSGSGGSVTGENANETLDSLK